MLDRISEGILCKILDGILSRLLDGILERISKNKKKESWRRILK